MRDIRRYILGGGDQKREKRKVKMSKLMNLSKLRRRVRIIKTNKAGIYERWGKEVYAEGGYKKVKAAGKVRGNYGGNRRDFSEVLF